MTRCLLDRLRRKRLLRKEHLLNVGEVFDGIYFVETGTLLAYKQAGNKQIVCRLLTEGNTCLITESFFQQSASSEAVLTTTGCFLSYLTYDDYTYLQNRFPGFSLIVLNLLLTILIEAEKCLYTFRVEDSAGRYEWLMKEHPVIVEAFMLRPISSYIGMSEVKLSQIINSRKT